MCLNKKINWILTQENQKLYILCIIEYTPTTTKTSQPWVTSATASVTVRAVFRRFRRNASTHYILSGTLLARFLFFTRGGEFYCFLYQCSLKRFFSDTGDVCRRLCRRPSLVVAHSEATRVLTTPYAVPHTCTLQKFVLWGCFGIETLPIEKIGGKKFATPATAFAGIHDSPLPVQV